MIYDGIFLFVEVNFVLKMHLAKIDCFLQSSKKSSLFHNFTFFHLFLKTPISYILFIFDQRACYSFYFLSSVNPLVSLPFFPFSYLLYFLLLSLLSRNIDSNFKAPIVFCALYLYLTYFIIFEHLLISKRSCSFLF